MSRCEAGKIFLLGVGAQKCGTTWLESELSGTSWFSNGGIKEFHVFNKLVAQRRNNPAKAMIRRRRKGKLDLIRLQEAMRLSPELYFDHFDYLHLREAAVTHVGDITPAYSMLPQSSFELIREGLTARGFTIRVILLMRDPVERAWSQLRMRNRLRHERQNAARVTAEQEVSQLRSFYRKPNCRSRTTYERMAETLEAVFSSEEIFYGFYETLFQQSEINRLTDFLETPALTPQFNRVVHASPKQSETVEGLDAVLNDMRAFFAPTYDWARRRFGPSVPTGWR